MYKLQLKQKKPQRNSKRENLELFPGWVLYEQNYD